MQDIADELGVSESRISQLRTEALALLKDGMNAQLAPEAVAPAAFPNGRAAKKRRAYYDDIAQRARSRRAPAR
jgi:RNA polymerase sigma factor for flagellar operon FliA